MQRKEMNDEEITADHHFENYVGGLTGGQPLSSEVRNFYEPRLGYDFSHVKVHTDSVASRSAQSINALAYTSGSNIVFNNGQYSPNTDTGKRLLAHELTHVVQQKSNNISMLQRMAACPASLRDDEPIPPGWRIYPGPTSVFHCGFRTILENRAPTPDDPMNECVYDHSGVLVDDSHPYSGCKGTPDQYDSRTDPIRHATIDSGGIVRQGIPAFITSRVYDVSTAIANGINAADRTIRGLTNAIGNVLLQSILTGKAICDPANWTFHVSVPGRTRRHLNVMGALLSSISLSGSLDNLLRNLTRPLRDFNIVGLLTEISADMNMAMQSGGDPTRISPDEIGIMSLYQFVEWLRTRSFISYNRPPEQIAQELLQAGGTTQP
jgi:hypothetical protein